MLNVLFEYGRTKPQLLTVSTERSGIITKCLTMPAQCLTVSPYPLTVLSPRLHLHPFRLRRSHIGHVRLEQWTECAKNIAGWVGHVIDYEHKSVTGSSGESLRLMFCWGHSTMQPGER
jgi:hypothetical protein